MESRASQKMWVDTTDLLIYQPRVPLTGKRRIIAFDLDSTLIKSKSGSKFAINAKDWKWNYPDVPVKLRKLPKDIVVVIVTNQGGLKTPEDISEFKKKIVAIHSELDMEIILYAAISGVYRKPSSALYMQYISKLVPTAPFLFVGDAAGRKGDFSDSDRAFAYNIAIHAPKIMFKTPEEFFLGEPENLYYEFADTGFDPRRYIESFEDSDVTDFDLIGLNISKNPLIIMCGPPASGKSSLATEIVTKYPRVAVISKDKLKNKAMETYKSYLRDGMLTRPVIIDNTSPSRESRAEYISLLSSKGPRRTHVIVIMTMAYKSATELFDLHLREELMRQSVMAKHMNRMRVQIALSKGLPPGHLPDIVYTMYIKKFAYPTQSEGIDTIVHHCMIPKFSCNEYLGYFLERD